MRPTYIKTALASWLLLAACSCPRRPAGPQAVASLPFALFKSGPCVSTHWVDPSVDVSPGSRPVITADHCLLCFYFSRHRESREPQRCISGNMTRRARSWRPGVSVRWVVHQLPGLVCMRLAGLAWMPCHHSVVVLRDRATEQLPLLPSSLHTFPSGVMFARWHLKPF